MSGILDNLNDDYKQNKKEATSKEEKQQIKHDYKEMKGLIKGADKLLKKHDEELKKMNAEWDKFDFLSLDEYKEYNTYIKNDDTLKEMNEKIETSQQRYEEQKKHSDEVMKKADETIKQIDEKLAELEKTEILEKTKHDYNNWKNEVLVRINSEEYQTIEEAKKKAKTTIKNENDLTSIWEKNKKYYVVLSRDREQAFRNYYKELIKYDDLFEEMKQDRSDYFTYKQGDIQFGNSQCDFCKYNDLNNKSICVKYPSGKPNNIINTEIRCKYLAMMEKQNDVKNLFEKDSNGTYIRLIIPSEFVCLILPEYNGNMDLRGKKDLDLTTDEVIVLKKYAYELTNKK